MITLAHGSAYATVNPNGAWIESLEDGNEAIFYPRTELRSESGERKARGGMHVCLPNFGPGGTNGLDQHGFGRNLEWRVISSDKNSLTLGLENPNPRYQGLVATLNYVLLDRSLTATLTTENNGATTMRIAPGFHPYFYVGESDTAISINETIYDLDSLAGTEFIEADKVLVKTPARQISIAQTQLNYWALWTDRLANYVCVEPTYGGNLFLKEPSDDELLESGKQKEYGCSISW